MAGGFLGLLAYLSIFAATLWVLWRSKAFTIAERSILTGLLAGYFCHNFFVFDNVTSYILFGTVLAFIVWREGDHKKSTPLLSTKKLPSYAAPLVAIVVLAATLGAVWEINVPALEANVAILGGLEQSPNGLAGNLASFNNAISYNTFGTQEAREQLIQIASQIATSQDVPIDVKQQILNTALSQMIEQSKVSPLDARFPLFIGVTEDVYGDYTDAQVALQKAHELSPQKQSIMYEQGFNAQARKDYASALQIFKAAYELETDDTQSQIYYAAAAIFAGNQTLADQLLNPLIPSGQAADSHVAAAYAANKQYNKIVIIWKAYLVVNPTNDPQAYFTLAAAYYASGDHVSAIQTLNTAETEIPSVKNQADGFISQIKAGTVKP